MERSQESWVNIGKFVAIFAVMTDHLRGSLYSLEGIGRASYFSVTLFILLMGVTTYWSFNNSTIVLYKKVTKRLLGMVIPYTISVFVYHCISYRGFDWMNYRNSLINFNVTGPHYYVLLYIQLVLIAPIIFVLIKRTESLSSRRRKIAEFVCGGGHILCIYN